MINNFIGKKENKELDINSNNKNEVKNEMKYIFSKPMKFLVIVFALFYVIIALNGAFVLMGEQNTSYSSMLILKNIFMSLIAIGVIINLIFFKRKGEILALIGVILFILMLLLSVFFLKG